MIRESSTARGPPGSASMPHELRAEGVRVIADPPGMPGYRGIYLLRLGDGCTIGAPPDIADHVRERAAGTDADNGVHAGRGPDARRGRRHPGARPSRHAYLDADAFVAPAPCDARRLGPHDVAVIDAFRDGVDDAEWGEGGFAHDRPYADVLWGAFADGDLVAMGNMTDFDGQPADVGLVTRPDVRGRGYGARLAGSMVTSALRTIPVIRYRTLEANAPSPPCGRKLGFVPDGGNMAVRLRT